MLVLGHSDADRGSDRGALPRLRGSAPRGQYQMACHFTQSPRNFAAIAELNKAGFQVSSLAPNRLIIHAAALSVVVENFFKTEIHSVSQSAHGERFMNVTPATLPEALAALVRGVRLDNLIVAHKMARRVSVVTNTIRGPITGPDGGYTPVALAWSFNFPVQHGYDGTGHTAAVIIDSDVATSLGAHWIDVAKMLSRLFR
jgi:hypothetical protein